MSPTIPTANFLYINQKDGTFKEAAFPMGVAVSEDGAEQGSMGVAVGDYDNTRTLQPLGHATSRRSTTRSTTTTATTSPTRHSDRRRPPSACRYVGWGNAFFDYDNDGVARHDRRQRSCLPATRPGKAARVGGYRQRKLLFHNRGDGTFDEVGAQAGAVMTEERVSRGLAIGDLDDDGKLDVVINDLDGSPQVLRNEITPIGNWLQGAPQRPRREFRCDRRHCRRPRRRTPCSDGSCKAAAATFRRKTSGCSSGWARRGKPTRFEVTWPDGSTSALQNVKANQIIEMQQR